MSRKKTKIVELSEEDSNDGDYSVSEDDWIPNENESYTDSSDQFENSDIADKTEDEVTVKNSKSKATKVSKMRTSLSLRAKLYKKYKPIKIIKQHSSKNTIETKKITTVDQNDDSDSSVDDYLVDPNKLDLSSNFFKSHQNEQTSASTIPIVPTFDCNAGMKLSDDDDEDDDDDNVSNDDNKNYIKYKSKTSQAIGSNADPSLKSYAIGHFDNFTKQMDNIKNQLDKYSLNKIDTNNVSNNDNVDVSKLLALGEESGTGNNKPIRKKRKRVDSNHLSHSDWEEVTETTNTSETPIKNVEVTVRPFVAVKNKKEIDIEACLKRRLNLQKKTDQLYLHKTHLLCLIGHGNYVNRILNNPDLMTMCNKLLPSSNSYPKGPTDIKYFESITRWFKTVIGLKGEKMYSCMKKLPPADVSLALQIQSKNAICKKDFVLIFIILLRSMDIQCRMVINLATVPLRPPQSELWSIKNKQLLTETKGNEKKVTNNNEKRNDIKFVSKEVKKPLTKNTLKDEKTLPNNGNNFDKKKINNEAARKNENKIKEPEVIHKLKNKSESIVVDQKFCKNIQNNSLTIQESPIFKRIRNNSKNLTGIKMYTNEIENKHNNNNNPIIKPSTSSEQMNLNKNVIKSQTLVNNQSPIPTRTRQKLKEKLANANKTISTLKTHPIANKSTYKIPQLDGNDDIKPKNLRKRKLYPSNNNNNNGATTIKNIPTKKLKITETKQNLITHSDSDDSDFKPSTSTKRIVKPINQTKSKNLNKSKTIDTRLLSTDDDEENKKKKQGMDYWIEVYAEKEKKWVTINLFTSKIDNVDDIRKAASQPLAYILAWNNDNTLKDVSPRYCPLWNTVSRTLRVDKKWFETAIRKYIGKKTSRDVTEDKELNKIHMDKPLPTAISEFKNHPLYVLERHLLKFEAIYPPNALTLGFIRNEPVYARECVHTLHSREIWVKQARVVKLGETAYKVVMARPKWDRLTNSMLKPEKLEIFGFWQTQPYEPPTAENGIVPRNAYGNVELFKPEMLPKKTVHLQLPGLNRTCKKLNIDCAQAVVGFDFHSGSSHPTFDGFVVCEEFSEIVVDQWLRDQEEAERRETEKYNQRVYGNWKKLFKGLLIRERLQKVYNFSKKKKI